MTNEQIIWASRLDLLKTGKIKSTGRLIAAIDESGKKSFVSEPEDMHTFREWKKRGYAVKKGEKAVVKLPIWKYKKDDDSESETNDESSKKMFLKSSAFFTSSQVEPLQKEVFHDVVS